MKNKYFKPTLISRTEEDLLYNTFDLYVCAISVLIAFLLDQKAWNIGTIVAMAMISYLLYRMGYKLGAKHRK